MPVVRKWGNSLACRIPAHLARQLHLGENTRVHCAAVDGSLMITPVTAGRPYSLEQMLDRITPGNSPGERCRDEAGGPANLLNASYIPERGDLVWLDFPNQEGQGPGGRRPALVLSPGSYNGKAGLALMCPVITRLKGYPFEVEIPGDCRIWGGVLADQVKIKDWRGRRAEFIRRLPGPVIGDVLARLALLLS